MCSVLALDCKYGMRADLLLARHFGHLQNYIHLKCNVGFLHSVNGHIRFLLCMFFIHPHSYFTAKCVKSIFNVYLCFERKMWLAFKDLLSISRKLLKLQNQFVTANAQNWPRPPECSE